MERVQIFCYNQMIEVDADMVKKHMRKSALVKEARSLQIEWDKNRSPALDDQINKVMGQIIRLNRTIRKTTTSVKVA